MQARLFYESIDDALGEVVRRCGGRKRFAAEMWPDKSVRDAHNLLDACLNPDRREHLTPEQMLYVARRGHAAGCHALMEYLAAECGYSVTPVEPQDEMAALQREFITAAETMAAMAARIEHLVASTTPAPLGPVTFKTVG